MIIKWDITIPQLSGDQVRKAYVYLPESYEEEAKAVFATASAVRPGMVIAL